MSDRVAMADRSVRLAPLDDAERRRFAQEQVAEFAREKVEAGEWSRAEAEARSRDAHRELLDGTLPAGHALLQALDASGARVAWLWVGPPPASLARPGLEWLYQITVPEDRRGAGWGRAALAALERARAAKGATVLRLNVFRWNVAAIALYRKSGYVEVAGGPTWVHYEKTLA